MNVTNLRTDVAENTTVGNLKGNSPPRQPLPQDYVILGQVLLRGEHPVCPDLSPPPPEFPRQGRSRKKMEGPEAKVKRIQAQG